MITTKVTTSVLLIAMLLLAACSSTQLGKTNDPSTAAGNQQAATAIVPVTAPQQSPTAAQSATDVPTHAVVTYATAVPTSTIVPSPTLAPTAAFTVTEVETSVDLGGISQASYNATCLAALAFQANISTNGAGTVTYYWLRSNGTRSKTATLTFTSAGYQTVKDAWTASGTGVSVSASDRVYIDQPTHQAYSAAGFSLTCNPVLPTPRPVRKR
jgi:hypothetical protein